MKQEKFWLESDSEDDSDDDSDDDDRKKCDHKPIQSKLYYENKEILKETQSYLSYIALALILTVIFLTSWIGLEEGKFPYNVDFMADIAYSKYRFGTPAFALFITMVLGVIFLYTRRFLMQFGTETCYKTITEHLQAQGKIRKIKPKPPKELRFKK